RFAKLAEINGDLPSRLTVAEAALKARLWGEARRHLDSAARQSETRELCRLMAELEEGERGDAAAARSWLKRGLAAPADASWGGGRCGRQHARWTARCPACAAFDTLSYGRGEVPRIPVPDQAAGPETEPAAARLPSPEPVQTEGSVEAARSIT